MTPSGYPSTIQELAACYKNEINSFNENLPDKAKENLARHLMTYEKHQQREWIKKCPLISDILYLANHLEWSDSLDINKDWQELIKYINLFNKQVNGKD